MIMLYFSGTGNSKYIAELFSREMNAGSYSIEEDVDFSELISANDTIGFCYPIYASRVPRILRSFVARHMDVLKGKKLIIFCTQMLFSGDGARAFTSLFPCGHVDVVYAEHFLMPTNVNNLLILPLAGDKSVEKYIARAQRKVQAVCADIKAGKVKRRGFNLGSRLLGLPQAAVLPLMERKFNSAVRVRKSCDGCGLCVKLCPMQNLVLEDGRITHKRDCTACYRCVNKCPRGAITVGFHGKVRGRYWGPEA